jgi:hypothetical protein
MPDRAADVARAWARELGDVLAEMGARGGRIGLDRLDTFGFIALHRAASTWSTRARSRSPRAT